MAQTVAPAPSLEEIRGLLSTHYEPEEFGLLMRELQAWRRERRWGLGILGVLVLGMVVLAMRPALIPYPIVYDPDGRIVWHGVAALTQEEVFIDVRLTEWIRWARAVSSDESRFRQDREQAAAMVVGEAAKGFSPYQKAASAAYLDRYKRTLVEIDPNDMTIVREGPQTVRITWQERWTPAVGQGFEMHTFQGILTYAWYAKPKGWTTAQARLNPSRVFVTTYAWDEIRKGAP